MVLGTDDLMRCCTRHALGLNERVWAACGTTQGLCSVGASPSCGWLKDVVVRVVRVVVVDEVDEVITPKKQQKNRGSSLGPGGFLYLYTLRNSKDWNYNTDTQTFRWGQSQKHDKCCERLKQHAREHPNNELEIIGMWRIEHGIGHKETEVTTKIKNRDMQNSAVGTSMSDFFIGDKDTIKDIINGTLPNGCEMKCEEYPTLY